MATYSSEVGPSLRNGTIAVAGSLVLAPDVLDVSLGELNRFGTLVGL